MYMHNQTEFWHSNLSWRTAMPKLPWARKRCVKFQVFLPRDAVLPRHLLSCVRLSVRQKPVMYRNDCTETAGFWRGGFFPPVTRCVVRKFDYLQKIRVGLLPSGTSTASIDSLLSSSIIHSLFHSRLKALKPSVSANPSNRSLPFLLPDWLHGLPGLFTDIYWYCRPKYPFFITF